MSVHGWVTPLPQGAKARCGGPGMCGHCMAEKVVNRGCPTQNGQCLYCKAMASPARFEHMAGCLWPPFERAFS